MSNIIAKDYSSTLKSKSVKGIAVFDTQKSQNSVERHSTF